MEKNKINIIMGLLLTFSPASAVFANDVVSGYTELYYSSRLKTTWKYEDLKTLVARTILPCPLRNTNGTRNDELLEQVSDDRMFLINKTISTLADPIGSSRKSIMIDPSIIGKHYLPAWMPGYVVKVGIDEKNLKVSITK